jgi:hypothetical protein
MAGAAAYMVNSRCDPMSVHVFGRFEEKMLISANDAFHCWIEADGVIIDFMAPLFNAALRSVGSTISIPKRMFQKSASDVANAFDDMKKEGDFLLAPNSALARTLFDSFLGRPRSVDLVHVCTTWYSRSPTQLRDMSMQEDRGNVYPLALKGPEIEGTW